MQWLRKAAENGLADSCVRLAMSVYEDRPYAREVGHVEDTTELERAVSTAGVMEGHNIPPDVLTSVVHWFHKGCVTGLYDFSDHLEACRRLALQGGTYCDNDGCEVVGHLKDFKVCPQCKTARYCGAACQKQDWTTGGHKDICGTAAAQRTCFEGSYSPHDT